MQKEEVEKMLHDKVEAGEHVSPILPEGVKNYLIDIDGTITDDIPNEEPENGNLQTISGCFKNVE